MPEQLHYVCTICHRERPVSEGRDLGTGSWICLDTDECVGFLVHPVKLIKAAAKGGLRCLTTPTPGLCSA